MQAPRYTLRVSVRPLGNAPISGIDSEPTIDIETVRVTVKQRGPYLVLQAGDFDSAEGAEAFLPRIKRGLWNLALEHNIAFIPYFERRSITRPQDPYVAAINLAKSFGMPAENPVQPVHGLTEEEGYTIFHATETVRFIGLDGGSATISTGWEQVSKTLSAGIGQVRPQADDADNSLATAIDLYLSHFYETSVRARFLTLMMVLEVLAPVTEKHAAAVQVLTKLVKAIEVQLAVESDPEARDALESLLRETEFRKETSIRRRIRRLVLDEIPLSDADRQSLARKVISAYDLRGSVVHTGSVAPDALAAASQTALNTVKLLLRARVGLVPFAPNE